MQHRYPCGSLSRRQFLAASAASVPLISGVPILAASQGVIGKTTHQGGEGKPPSKLAAPGLYPGRVLEVQNPRMIHNGTKDRAAIKATLDHGMKTLTGATDAVEAWKHFFEPGDVVGIKVVPNGQPHAHSSFEIVLEVIEKLKASGVKSRDIFVYDRYRGELMEAGYHKILPSDIKWGGLDPDGNQFKLDFPSYAKDPIAGFDRDAFVWMDLVPYGDDPKDDSKYRSHLGKLVSRTGQQDRRDPGDEGPRFGGGDGLLEEHEPRFGQQRGALAQQQLHQRLQPVHPPDGQPPDHPREVRPPDHGRHPRRLPGRALRPGSEVDLGEQRHPLRGPTRSPWTTSSGTRSMHSDSSTVFRKSRPPERRPSTR